MAQKPTRPVAAVILAAGQGTRMKSTTPKVLHKIGGRSMLEWSVALAQSLGASPIVTVVSKTGQAVADAAKAAGATHTVVQDPQLGTGHAVLQARAALGGFTGDVIVLYADTPLITPETCAALLAHLPVGGVGVLGFEPELAGQYGRLIRNADGTLARIVEAKDASDAEKAVRLCNSGVMAADAATMMRLLDAVEPNNAAGEYYLTDIVGLARASGAVCIVEVARAEEVMGVNSRVELAAAEAAFQTRVRTSMMLSGVTLRAPETVFFSHDTQLAPDVIVEPHVVFGVGVTVEQGAEIRAFSHLEGAHVGEHALIGPYARLRPGADIGAEAHIGNFVEIKKSKIGVGAKANHLAYIGDAFIGARANIGAGTITCNYDGYAKSVTHVGDDAFIGSDTALVAPVRVGARAYTGSGSVITDDVPDDALALARGMQVVKEGWAATFRARKAAEKASRTED